MAQSEDEDGSGDAYGVGDRGGTAGGERVLGARQGVLQQGVGKQGDERVGAVDVASTWYGSLRVEVEREGLADAFYVKALAQCLRQVPRERIRGRW